MGEVDEAALARAGITLGEGDVEVLRLVAAAFAPAMELLDRADLRELALEPGLDPSRPPL